MSKSLRYVKDFEFPSEFGFSRSAGKQQVKGYARGGKAHGDAMQDRKMVKAAVRKHEKAQHPGEPLTKLKKGGEIETKTERKQYQKKTTGKNSKSVEAGVLEAKKRLETIPYTDAQRAMQAAAAIDIENENRRLEKEIIEAKSERKRYQKKTTGKNSKSVEAEVLEAKKRLETIPYTDAQRAMQAAAAIDIENENRRLEKEIIEGGGELPEYLKKKYGLKRGGGVGQGMMKKQGPQDGSGQRRGKGSFNREPMLKCGGKVKK